MSRFVLSIALALAVVSCDQMSGDKKVEAPAPGAPPAAGSSSSEKPPMPVLNPEKAKAAAGSAVEDSKKAVNAVVGEAKEATASAKESAANAVTAGKDAARDVAASMPELANVAESSFSVAKLKEFAGKLNPDQLKGIADKLVAAIQEKGGLVKALTEQLGKLGATDIGKTADLTQQLSAAKDLLPSLKEKLQVVVDKLKASGVDVSKYTSFLTGN